MTFSTTTLKHLKDAGMSPEQRLTSESFKAKMERSWLVNIKKPPIRSSNLLKIEEFNYSEVRDKIKMMFKIVSDVVRPIGYNVYAIF